MTFEEYIDHLKSYKKDLQAADVIAPAAQKMLNAIKVRVHIEGKNTNDVSFGSYSSKKWSYTQNQFYKKSAFKPDTPGSKYMTLPGGYKQLRSIQGMQSDKKKLKYSNQMQTGLVIQQNQKTVKIQETGTNNVRKKNALEEKLGPFYSANANEISIITDALVVASEKILTRK